MITYMYPFLGKGRVSLAIYHDRNTKDTLVGVAYSSPKDRFVRKKGRVIAAGRASVGSLLSFDFKLDSNKRLKEQVFEKFLQFNKTRGPNWARK